MGRRLKSNFSAEEQEKATANTYDRILILTRRGLIHDLCFVANPLPKKSPSKGRAYKLN
jgi:hypothetical protein